MEEAAVEAETSRKMPRKRPLTGELPIRGPSCQSVASKTKKWCFSISNYTEEDIERVQKLSEKEVLFGIAGREKGEEGTPHIQGYVNFKNPVRFAGLKKLLPRAHLEPARGSDGDNEEYCCKEGDVFWRQGEAQKKGKRNDLTRAVALVKAGRSMKEIAEEYPEAIVRYGRGLRNLQLLIKRK